MKSLPKLSWWRHAMRAAVLLFLFAIAGSNLHRHYKSQYGGQVEIDAHRGLRVIDRLNGSSPHLDRRPVTVSGGLWSFKVRGLRISDPLAVLSGLLTSRALPAALLLSVLIPVGGALLLGRVFCSWICPMGLFGEAVCGAKRWLERNGVQLLNLDISRLPKYVILVAGALICLLFSVPFLFWFYPPRIISDAVRDTWSGTLMTGELVFVGILLLCELVLCERLWCKCLCPGGGLLAWLGSARRLRVRQDQDLCTSCGACDVACPYDLAPSHSSLGGECDNCGRCIEVCNDDALQFHVRMPRPRNQSLVMLCICAVLMAAPSVATAHHIRGIPHYSYQENYPQVPLFEEFRDAGPWTLQFTFWPIPTQKALDLALYVKHTTTGNPYDDAVTFRVYQHGEDLSEGNHPFQAYANPRHIHKVGWVYEEDGIYYAQISLGEGDQAISETFRFQVGKVKPNYLVLGGAGAAVFALITIVAIIKKRQTSGQVPGV
ncbi:MAG: 4Fe-4S binding protein [Kiritimatiellia bacterium]|jgi:ferredoxin-type protein NapH|nr:4Fe-4S binding protein [Kiritimatiellia bacterium]